MVSTCVPTNITRMDTVSNERKSNEEKILDLIAKNGYVVRNDVDQLLDVSQTKYRKG